MSTSSKPHNAWFLDTLFHVHVREEVSCCCWHGIHVHVHGVFLYLTSPMSWRCSPQLYCCLPSSLSPLRPEEGSRYVYIPVQHMPHQSNLRVHVPSIHTQVHNTCTRVYMCVHDVHVCTYMYNVLFIPANNVHIQLQSACTCLWLYTAPLISFRWWVTVSVHCIIHGDSHWRASPLHQLQALSVSSN